MDEASDDDEVRESYNFAPGYYGAVYRADTSDYGGYDPHEEEAASEEPQDKGELKTEQSGENLGQGDKEIKYRLQSMKWGLVPFWTKRSPDYGSLMRTINCRDDSLLENRGMWTSMKKKKRCIVVCQGFYEWLKKGPSGKEKVPHFIKRKDGNLMCFAGLWDCVQYEGAYDSPMDMRYNFIFRSVVKEWLQAPTRNSTRIRLLQHLQTHSSSSFMIGCL